MFTNWLTQSQNQHQQPSIISASSSSSSSNTVPQFSGILQSNVPPPDVILEVGSTPPFTRFIAHSNLLSIHSGYLRSALRFDDQHSQSHHNHPHHMHMQQRIQILSNSHHHPHPNPHQQSHTSSIDGEPTSLISSSNSHHIQNTIYLPNVTPEQFSPLLTYMYTGYLELTIENIFGVLLATHVLHMPRALEICRLFLSRIQSIENNYLNTQQQQQQSHQIENNAAFQHQRQHSDNTTNNNHSTNNIIRPIPSKPSMIGNALQFISSPISNILVPSHDTPFKCLFNNTNQTAAAAATTVVVADNDNENDDDFNGQHKTKHLSNRLSVTFEQKQSISKSDENFSHIDKIENPFVTKDKSSQIITPRTTSITPKLITTQTTTIKSPSIIRKKSKTIKKYFNLENQSKESVTNASAMNTTTSITSSTKTNSTSSSPSSSASTTTIQNIRTNIPSTTTTTTTTTPYTSAISQTNKSSSAEDQQLTQNKIIIDVASCDGPVRFRRVLNDAYERQIINNNQQTTPATTTIAAPSKTNGTSTTSTNGTPANVPLSVQQQNEQRRLQQNVTLSFHQQMAKNISESQQLIKENAQQQPINKSITSSGSDELYCCVYCNHTFKSQYCYQKHAKRHINPLALVDTDDSIVDVHSGSSTSTSSSSSSGDSNNGSNNNSSSEDNNHSDSTNAINEKIIIKKNKKKRRVVQQSSSNSSIIASSSSLSLSSSSTFTSNTSLKIPEENKLINLQTIHQHISPSTSTTNLLLSSTSNSLISLNSNSTSTTSSSSYNPNKREVRPLDMNVQYYPCKTCGSKFPSYYFVHKHRKLCHANEDN